MQRSLGARLLRRAALWQLPRGGAQRGISASATDASEATAPPRKQRKPSRGARQKGQLLVDISQSLQSSLQSLDQQPAAAAAAAPAEVVQGALDGKFRLEPAEVQAMLRKHGVTEGELLQLLITPASQLARPPISSYRVGAVGLGASGALYVGVNLEFARLPLYNSVHAEQFLIANALHHGERGIRKVAVSAAPCGHCRQFMSELACAETMRISFGGGSYSLDNLLPNRFGPKDLLEDPSTPLLLQPQDNPVVLGSAARGQLAARSGDGAFQRAAADALQEATRSYAPYSKCPAGAAIITAEGEVYSGPYLESAAYNPSLPPLQTAIIDAVIDGMPCYTEVREVVLVELENAPVQHAPSVRVALEQIAPGAQLTVLSAEWQQ